MTTEKQNPYAVSPAVDPENPEVGAHTASLIEGAPTSYDPDVVGSAGMVLGAIGATTVAGTVFGIGAGGLVMLLDTFSAGPTDAGSFFSFLLMAPVIGGIFAVSPAVPVSLVCWWLSALIRRPSGLWNDLAMRLVYLGTGTLSGWLPLVCISGFRMEAAALSLVPAAVGFLVCAFGIERKIRRARAAQSRLDRVSSSGPTKSTLVVG